MPCGRMAAGGCVRVVDVSGTHNVCPWLVPVVTVVPRSVPCGVMSPRPQPPVILVATGIQSPGCRPTWLGGWRACGGLPAQSSLASAALGAWKGLWIPAAPVILESQRESRALVASDMVVGMEGVGGLPARSSLLWPGWRMGGGLWGFPPPRHSRRNGNASEPWLSSDHGLGGWRAWRVAGAVFVQGRGSGYGAWKGHRGTRSRPDYAPRHSRRKPVESRALVVPARSCPLGNRRAWAGCRRGLRCCGRVGSM